MIWRVLVTMERFLSSNVLQFLCFSWFMVEVTKALELGFGTYLVGMVAFAGMITKLEELHRDRGSKPARAETEHMGSVHESPGSAQQKSPEKPSENT